MMKGKENTTYSELWAQIAWFLINYLVARPFAMVFEYVKQSLHKPNNTA